jgi:predicted regulator of Ras-like GTPase activity (Roadblock/LC7/MglB family)
MFGFLKKLMGQKETVSKLATVNSSAADGVPARPAANASAIQTPAHSGNGEFIELPLKMILDRLPAAARGVVSGPAGAGDRFHLSSKTILNQLPSGRIRISIRELRQAAPPNLFAASTGQDEVLVELPLPEVLSRLKPNQLSRREGQKKVEVSKEISPVFGPTGRIACPTPDSPAQENGRSRHEPAPPISASLGAGGDAISTSNPRLPSVAGPALSAQHHAAPVQKDEVPSTDAVLTLPMASLLEAWPEAARQKFAHADFQKSALELPWAELERELKRGKVQFAWKQLSAWIKPSLSSVNGAINGELILELPLPIIASAFMARRKFRSESKRQNLVTADIPNLFASKGPSAAIVPPAPPSGAQPTPPASSPEDNSKKTVQELGDVFGQPDKRSWSPTEIVDRTARLDGIAGALLATLDGLLIVGRIPPELSGDKIAAFVPMMFARMAQYSRELNLGDPSHLTFHIEDFPLQVFKAGRVYFTALGRPGEALPRTQLAAVAAALGRPAHS